MKIWLEDAWLSIRAAWRLFRTGDLVQTLEWVDAEQLKKGR